MTEEMGRGDGQGLARFAYLNPRRASREASRGRLFASNGHGASFQGLLKKGVPIGFGPVEREK